MYIRIHCETCGGTWEVYQRDNWNDDKARQCPHCFSKIDRQTWHDYILPAFGLSADANAELLKDHSGSYKPLFSVDLIADHLYTNRNTGGTCPLFRELDDLQI